MFGKLAYEKHKLVVESDQLGLICEAAEDIAGDPNSDEIKMDELDKVMDSDAEAVQQADIDKLETLIGEIAEDEKKTDVANMTKAEIEKHVASVNTAESISDLNA